LRSSVCFFCWILFIYTSRLLFSLLLAGGYHRLFFIFVVPVSSMCMQTSNFIDVEHFQFFFKLRLFLVSSLFFLFALSCLVVLLLCPIFVLYYFAILPGRRCWPFGVFPTDLVSCFFTIQVSHASFNQEHTTMEKNV
jgi:hypothetical protein